MLGSRTKHLAVYRARVDRESHKRRRLYTFPGHFETGTLGIERKSLGECGASEVSFTPGSVEYQSTKGGFKRRRAALFRTTIAELTTARLRNFAAVLASHLSSPFPACVGGRASARQKESESDARRFDIVTWKYVPVSRAYACWRVHVASLRVCRATVCRRI